MLREMRHIRQEPKDYFRRWFADEDLHLYIWYKPDDAIYGFQLCYDLNDNARAVTWTENKGFRHDGIDTGDDNPQANRTPILVPNSHFEPVKVYALFRNSDREFPSNIRDFVWGTFEACLPKS